MKYPQKSFLATAMATVISTTANPVCADIIEMSFGTISDAWFTMINADGTSIVRNSDATGPSPSGIVLYGIRTPVSGTMMFDTDNHTGTVTIDSFSFFGSGLAENTGTTFQAIGDGTGKSGPLLLGNMSWDWAGNNGMPVSIVWDATGLFDAIDGGLTTGDVITGGTLPATDDFKVNNGKTSYTVPIGPGPVVTTTFNTTDIGTVTLGSNLSGTLPLTNDGIGGSPMRTYPFPGFNTNFDIMSLKVDSVSTVPVPAAAWLFGSGLLGLIGIARGKKS